MPRPAPELVFILQPYGRWQGRKDEVLSHKLPQAPGAV